FSLGDPPAKTRGAPAPTSPTPNPIVEIFFKNSLRSILLSMVILIYLIVDSVVLQRTGAFCKTVLLPNIRICAISKAFTVICLLPGRALKPNPHPGREPYPSGF